jgi:apolipoprotein D and lipocalin family protein
MNFVPESSRLVALATLALCAPMSGCRSRPPLAQERHVDVSRFMGDWYLIACIPTRIERGAYGPKESYTLDPQGRIPTVFTFRQGGFQGAPKRYTPTGFVQLGSGGTVWGMQFIGPIKADYRIIYVDSAYQLTVIGREKRDYAWLMARTPRIAESDFERLRTRLASQGYDVPSLRRMPQPQQP